MDQEGIDSVYGLSKTFFVHGGAARTVDVKGDKMVSGGIDKKVVYFERGENGIFEKKSEYRFFPDYVYQVKIMEDEDQFMVACKDGKIYICMFADTEAPMLLLEGHTGPVNSLHQKGMKLVSGSWDATAKIWDLESGEASATMGGHSYAVTVCILENGLIITGSQDGALRLWSGDGTLVKTKHAAHGDIIREIIEVPNIGILTCANDASIKLWGAMNLEQFGEYQHHESYVFALESLGGSNFVSGGEDKRLKVCVDQKIVDDILHPNTIWSIVLDTKNDNDLITTCGDGAPKDEIESFENEAKMASLQGPEMDQKTLMSFDTVDKMDQIKGKKEGEIRVFRTGNIPKAYMWKGNKWELIGDVMGQQHAKKAYAGDRYFPAGEYDYIFDIQDDSGISRKLPYNEGDNTLVCAEKFLVREGMNMGYKEQIMGFIVKNTRGGGKKINNKPKAKKQEAALQPLRESKFFKKMNLDGLQNKLLELNEDLVAQKAEGALSENDVKHLKTLIVKLRDPTIYNYIKEFNSFESAIIFTLLKWPGTHIIPVIDLLRIFVTHHASQAFFSGVSSGLDLMVSVVSKLKTAPKVVVKIYLKFLTNLCIHDSTSVGLVKASDILFNSFVLIDQQDPKVMVLLANFFMTVSSKVDVIMTANDDFAGKFVNSMAAMVNSTAVNDEILMKFAIATINFAVLKPGCKSSTLVALANLLVGKLEAVQNGVKDRLVSNLKEIVGN